MDKRSPLLTQSSPQKVDSDPDFASHPSTLSSTSTAVDVPPRDEDDPDKIRTMCCSPTDFRREDGRVTISSRSSFTTNVANHENVKVASQNPELIPIFPTDKSHHRYYGQAKIT